MELREEITRPSDQKVSWSVSACVRHARACNTANHEMSNYVKKVIPLTELLGEQPFYLGGYSGQQAPGASSLGIEGIVPTLLKHVGGLDGIVGWAKDTFGSAITDLFSYKGGITKRPKKVEVVIPKRPVGRRLGMAMMPTPGFEAKADSVVAHNLTTVNPSYFALESAPADPDLGPGTRVVFRQPLCWMGQGADDGTRGAFHLIPLSDVNISQNFFQVHPANFGGRLNSFGKLFDRYNFKLLRLIMIPSAPTTVEGQVALCFVPDVYYPTLQGSPLSFYEIMTTMPSMASPFREAADFSVFHFGRDIKYCDVSSASHADGRLDYAGIIASDYVGPSSQAGKTGMLICFAEGVVDFYSPCAIHDYTLERVPRSIKRTFDELIRVDQERKKADAERAAEERKDPIIVRSEEPSDPRTQQLLKKKF